VHPPIVLSEKPETPMIREPSETATDVTRRTDVTHPCLIASGIEDSRSTRRWIDGDEPSPGIVGGSNGCHRRSRIR
jgi:hypothetical protein